MTVLIQKDIKFLNDCNCIVDCALLMEAILWYQKKPTLSVKHIYLYNKYPTISIHNEKIRVHRLLMMYIKGIKFSSDTIVHHKDKNILNSSIENLVILSNKQHLSLHNKGRSVPSEQIKRVIQYNKSRKGCIKPPWASPRNTCKKCNHFVKAIDKNKGVYFCKFCNKQLLQSEIFINRLRYKEADNG